MKGLAGSILEHCESLTYILEYIKTRTVCEDTRAVY